MLYRLFFILAALQFYFCAIAMAEPVTTHPRLLFREDDLPALRAQMMPSNDVWVSFKQNIVDKCLRDWKCSSTQHQAGPPNYEWIRDSFTDEFGVTHYPTDPDWDVYASDIARPAAPEGDVGEATGNVRLMNEQYAMVFALMARLLKDQPGQEIQRAEYLAAAKECLFYVIDKAHLGHANLPWRTDDFALSARSFSNEAFALTVDWIYEDFTPLELAKIRKTFLLWAADCNGHVYYAPKVENGQHRPANTPSVLLQDIPDEVERRSEIRLSLNNHWGNHLRQTLMSALAMDPEDDIPSAFVEVDDPAPAGSLTSQVTGSTPNQWIPIQNGVLYDVTGVWLYLTDYAYRHDGLGAVSEEGIEYATNGLGPVAAAMACLNSAGQDDPKVWGSQVSLLRHPFWSRTVQAYLSQLTPTTRIATGSGYGYLGPIFQPPVAGDQESFVHVNDQWIKFLAPMALYDKRVNGTNGQIIQAVRYIQRNLAKGGPSAIDTRIRDNYSEKRLRDAIYYFLLFDPNATPAQDPRPAFQPLTFYAKHVVKGREMGIVMARSGYTPSDTYFHWRNDWNKIDHQRGDSLSFGLWKNTLWLTKVMGGYGSLQGCSDYRNSLSLENGEVIVDGNVNQSVVGESVTGPHGSQWNYSPFGDPDITARSTAESFIYFTGDATNLYNHFFWQNLQEMLHASRSIVWLKPDHVVVYDRAKSKQAGYFKRFFLNLPEDQNSVDINGSVVHATASEVNGQIVTPKAELFVTSLLPIGATPQLTDIASGQPADGEDMKCRLFVEAPGDPQEARFLHVLQGTDAGVVTPDPAQLIQSTGAEFEGAVVGTTCVMFRKNLNETADTFSYAHPANVTKHYITGLGKHTGYSISQTATSVSIQPGTQIFSDGGGVIVLGGIEPPNVEIFSADNTGSEVGMDSVSFLLKRSGDVTAPLTVNVGFSDLSAANAADFTSVPTTVVFPANSETTTFSLTPVDDSVYEGNEEVVMTVLPGAGYHASEAENEARATISDNDQPPGGLFVFNTTNITVAENGAPISIQVDRVGGTAGAATVTVFVGSGTATGGVDFNAPNTTLTWADGEGGSKMFIFTPVDDSIYEGDETVPLSLTQATGQAEVGNPAAATVTILEDEPPPPGQFELTASETTIVEGQVPSITFTVKRLNGTGGAVSVQYATVNGTATDGSDFNAQSGTLNWADGSNETKTVVVPIIDDTIYEGASETFSFELSNPTGGASFNGSQTATITITENDPQPQSWHIGPGQAYATPADLPWVSVGAGSDVFLHYSPTPYHSKVLISNRGTAEQPIRIIGLPGPNGERPVLDGNGAATSNSALFVPYSYVEDRGVIVIARHKDQSGTFKPGYIEIHGLEIINAHPDYSFTTQAGDPANYSSSAGGIFLSGADHVSILDCVIHHCANGIVTNNGGASEPDLVRDLVIDRCDLYSNGKAGAYYGRNLDTQAVGVTLQFSRLSTPLSGTNVPNILDRSAGFIARYSWVEGGGAQFDLDEPSSNVPLLSGDPSFATAHIWGCIIRNLDSNSGNIVQFGGTNVTGPRTLHFHHNTVHAANGYGRTVLNMRDTDENALAWNNVFYSVSITEFRLVSGVGSAEFGKNLASPSYFTPLPNATGLANIVTAPAPGFVNVGSADYHPSAGSPLLDNAATLPAGAKPLTAQYVAHASGALRVPLGSAADLGAFEGTALPPDLDDPDSDNMPNILEAAFWLNPLEPDASPVAPWLEDGKLTIFLTKPATSEGLIFSAEVSGDLVNWQSLTPLFNTRTLFKATDDTPAKDAGKRFIRLRTTR